MEELGETRRTVVAGGNGEGNQLNQFHYLKNVLGLESVPLMPEDEYSPQRTLDSCKTRYFHVFIENVFLAPEVYL